MGPPLNADALDHPQGSLAPITVTVRIQSLSKVEPPRPFYRGASHIRSDPSALLGRAAARVDGNLGASEFGWDPPPPPLFCARTLPLGHLCAQSRMSLRGAEDLVRCATGRLALLCGEAHEFAVRRTHPRGWTVAKTCHGERSHCPSSHVHDRSGYISSDDRHRRRLALRYRHGARRPFLSGAYFIHRAWQRGSDKR